MSFNHLQIKRLVQSGADMANYVYEGELLVDLSAGNLYVGPSTTNYVPNLILLNDRPSALSFSAGTTSGPILYLSTTSSSFSATIPSASDTASGIVTTGEQTFAGIKTFISSMLVDNDLVVSDNLTVGGDINAATIYANFNGNLIGNASTASALYEAVTINGTSFDGSANIEATEYWGTARNIVISPAASSSASDGTDIDGKADATLYIPATMTGFSSITSTTLLGTDLGGSAAASHWTNLYVRNPYIYNSAGTFYNLLTSNATSSNKTLILPDANGELVYHTNGTAIGGSNIPVYVAASGEITACGIIKVANGGTGLGTIETGAILIGNGTSAIDLVSPVTKGRLLVSNGTSTKPIYAAPSLSWTAGTATTAPTIQFTVNDTSTTAVAIPFATGSVSGVVSATTQTFGGSKTFSGAVAMSNTLSVTGQLTAKVLFKAEGDIQISGKLKSNSSGASYLTLTDSAATLVSPIITLDGEKIVVSNDNYGDTLPDSGTEGQIFFLIS